MNDQVSFLAQPGLLFSLDASYLPYEDHIRRQPSPKGHASGNQTSQSTVFSPVRTCPWKCTFFGLERADRVAPLCRLRASLSEGRHTEVSETLSYLPMKLAPHLSPPLTAPSSIVHLGRSRQNCV